MRLTDIARALLRGAGQVIFMDNALAGALFLAGITVGSCMNAVPTVAVGAAVGLACATAGGWLLCRDNGDGTQGLWGFNGVLVGCALPTFFECSWVMWGLLVAMSALSPMVRIWLNRAVSGLGINSLTFPFIALTWLAFVLPRMVAEGGSANGTECLLLQTAVAWLNGISQIFLVCSPVCGGLILLGLLAANRKAAISCAAGAAIGTAMALAFGMDTENVNAGLFGFNPALTSVALYAVFKRGIATALVGTVGTFFVQMAMTWALAYASLPGLTAPFCLATWIVLVLTRQGAGK